MIRVVAEFLTADAPMQVWEVFVVLGIAWTFGVCGAFGFIYERSMERRERAAPDPADADTVVSR